MPRARIRVALVLLLLAALSRAAEPSIPPAHLTNTPAVTAVLPVSVDLRPTFAKWGLKSRQQGGRPTCSAFTIAGALEFALAQHQQKGEPLSIEFLNWAANQARDHARDGGFFSDLWRGFAAHGICAEEQMPYQPAFVPSAIPSEDAVAKASSVRKLGFQLQWIKHWNVRTGLTEAQFASLKRTLHQGWPVGVGCRWPNEESWQRGVLQYCPPAAVHDGHSVLLVGYRDDPDQAGGGVFIFRNSSGGRDGFLPFAYALDYVNDAVWIAPVARGSRQ